MTNIDPAAIPPAETPDADDTALDDANAQIAALTAQLAALAPAAGTDAAAVASSPDTGASVPDPASSVPPPPVGSIVVRRVTLPGTESEIDTFGLVVAVDDTANTATVAWTNPTTTVPGASLTKIG